MGKSRAISDAELEVLLKQTGVHALRNKCMVLCSVLAGMTAKEMSELRFGDVIDSGTVRSEVVLNERVIYIHTRLREAMEVYLDSLDEPLADYPFFYTQKSASRGFSANSVSQLFLLLYAKAGLGGCSVMSGRNTQICRLLRLGVKEKIVKRISGHSVRSRLSVNVTDKKTDLRELVELIF